MRPAHPPASIRRCSNRSSIATVSMIPTLKMFATTASTDPAFLHPIYAVVRQFHALGGDFIFGTDVGYMTRLFHRR